MLDEYPGFASFVVEGHGARELFAGEGGGHRWQRVPPTERSGRCHTSTVTVAVLSPKSGPAPINERDVDFSCVVGTGPGGQHRNKSATCVVATHRPTGIRVRIDTRSQHRNKMIAMNVLAARLSGMEYLKLHANENESRRSQLGTGQRGDKIRTYRTQDDMVTDHRTGQRWKLSKWMRGDWS